MKLDQAVALVNHINDLALQNAVTKCDLRTWTSLFARLHQTLPDIILPSFQKKDLDHGTSLFLCP